MQPAEPPNVVYDVTVLGTAELTRPQYTRVQMVDIAASSGHHATERLLTDWQAAGLIDRPYKKGLGRGRGIVALWPESQLRLWLLLLEKRRQTGQVPNLCNVPVGLWLYFGDDYASIRQVRKCMRTWSERYGSSRGHKLAKQTARQLLADLPIATASKNVRARLVSEMASALLRGIRQNEDRRTLREQMLGAIDGHIHGYNKASAIVDLVLIRLVASHHLTHSDVLDHIFQWARVWHLFGLRSYVEALDSGKLPKMTGVEFDQPDFNRLIPSACRDLMSAVGMALTLGKEEVLPAPFFHPDSWKDGLGDVKVSHDIQASSILLPSGKPHMEIRATVAVQIDPTSRASKGSV